MEGDIPESRLIRDELRKVIEESHPGTEVGIVRTHEEKIRLIATEVLVRSAEVVADPDEGKVAELVFYLQEHVKINDKSWREVEDIMDTRHVNLGGIREGFTIPLRLDETSDSAETE